MSGLPFNRDFLPPQIGYIKDEKPKVREKIYKIKEAFYDQSINVCINCDDIIYSNVEDNNFYLEKKDGKITYSGQVDWSLAMKAIRYGWMKLVKVEKAE